MNTTESNHITYTRLGISAIVVGLILGIDTALHLQLYRLWPLLLLLAGISFLRIFANRRKREPFFLVMALLLIQCSLLFLFCSFAGWHFMQNLWPLFIGFLGVITMAANRVSLRKKGFFFLGLLYLSLMAVFFLVFSVQASLWWAILVFLGISLLISVRLQ